MPEQSTGRSTARSRRRHPDDVLDVHGGASGGLQKAVGAGVRWMGPSQVVNQVVRILMALVVARLLEPEDFGIVALVTVVVGFFERVLGDTGTTAALVRHKELTQGLASSVFFWNVTIGATTSLVFAVAASPISIVLGDEAAAELLRVLGLLALINALGYVQRALLRRLMRFSRLAIVNLGTAVVTAVATIVLAVIDPSPWALVLGNLAGAGAGVALAWILSGWAPSLTFRRSELRKVSGFSANVSLQNIFGYASFAGDRFVIGRFIGTTELGFYGLATRLMRYPLQTSAQTYREVVFPALSRVQDDDAALFRTYRRTVSGIAFVLMPLCAVVAALSDPLVAVVLGAKWAPAADLVAILALVGGLQSVATTTGSLYLAKGRPGLLLRWQMISSVVLVASYAAGASWGVEGVALGFLGGVALLTYPAFRIPLGLIGAKTKPLFLDLLPTVLIAAIAAEIALAIRLLLEDRNAPDVVVLLAGGAGAVAALAAYAYLARPKALADLLSVVRRRSPSGAEAETDTPDDVGAPAVAPETVTPKTTGADAEASTPGAS